MPEILTVYEEADKVVVTEQDDITVVTIVAQGPQGVPGSSILPDATATVKGAVRLSGDLGGTANAPTVPGLALKANISSLAEVALSGSYDDLTNKPTPVDISGKANITYVDTQDVAEQAGREAAETALQVEIDEKYELPVSGVERSDLDASTRASLTKADTALQVAPVTSVSGKTGAVIVTKGDVGLPLAENTADLDKPCPRLRLRSTRRRSTRWPAKDCPRTIM